MKLLPVVVSAAILLLTSATSNAGHGYFNAVGRNLGYGISDGYHAQRNCLNAGTTCSNCSPVQQPTMEQPIMPQPMTPQPVMPQPVMPQPVMPQPVMPQPVTAQPMMYPAYAQWAPYQFQPVGYPVGYPVTPMYQPSYQSYAPGYGQSVMPSVASPYRTPVSHW